MTIVIPLCASLLLVLANCFFVASEFALIKVRPTRLMMRAASGDRRARTALHISRRLDVYLSANQLGVTLASLGLGWLGEPAFARLLAPYLSSFGDWSGIASHGLAAALALALITTLHVVLGELVPKTLALDHAEAVALATAIPLHVFYLATLPVTWTLNAFARLTLRGLRVRAASDADRRHSAAELRLVLAQGNLDPGARRLIDRVFDYTRRTASQIMTMRRDVVVLKSAESFAANLEIALAHQFTRYPVVDSTDRVLGYAHIKDMTAALLAKRKQVHMSELIRDAVYAEADSGLEDIRRDLQTRHVHVAMVRDERGALLGIVTLEDLLEELVGEIRDEQDAAEVAPIVRGVPGRFEVDGRLTLDVAQRELDLRFDDVSSDVETIGEYVAAHLKAPKPGAFIHAGGYRLTVLEMRDNRLHRVRGERFAAEQQN
ncbi:MAG: hemolysin family protein [Myxococcota bacterium]